MKNLFYSNSTRLGILSCIVLLWILNSRCSAQTGNFTYKSIPRVYLPVGSDLAPYRVKADHAAVGAYDLTQSLPNGFVTDGSVDYTDYLQKGISNHKLVVFPDFPVLVNSKGLALISNSTVVFSRNSKIIMMPNGSSSYFVLAMYDIKNVILYFPVIEGERDRHLNNVGEWGNGIVISGASNIQIINPKVSNCWGDGIYIGRSKQVSRNIYIAYPQIDNNRRNGISIVSVDSLNLVHPAVSNTNGTEPMAAIDIEPNSNADVINNISIYRPVTFNSKRGIMLVLLALPGPIAKKVNIAISNHIDELSSSAFHYSSYKNAYSGNVLDGNIRITDPVWKNNAEPLFHGLNYGYGPNVEIKNITISDKNGQDITQPALDKIKANFINDNKVNIH